MKKKKKKKELKKKKRKKKEAKKETKKKEKRSKISVFPAKTRFVSKTFSKKPKKISIMKTKKVSNLNIKKTEIKPGKIEGKARGGKIIDQYDLNVDNAVVKIKIISGVEGCF